MALLTGVRARLGIHAHRNVVGLLDGGHASVQTGRGIEPAGRRISRIEDASPVPWFVRGDAQLSAKMAALDAARAEARRVRLQQLGIASAHLASADDALGAVQLLLERHRNAR